MSTPALQPRVAAGEVIRQFNESNKSPYIKRQQTIFHPGEVQLRMHHVHVTQVSCAALARSDCDTVCHTRIGQQDQGGA